MDDEPLGWLKERISQVEREQDEAWEKMPAGYTVENEDILGRFFDDVKGQLAAIEEAERRRYDNRGEH